MTALMVLLGGAVGAVARFVVDRWARNRWSWPWGILAVNVAGSFVLGVVMGSPGLPGWTRPLLGTGFCGALTTFSTFTWDTLALAEGRTPWEALANVAVSLLLGLGACALGLVLGGL